MYKDVVKPTLTLIIIAGVISFLLALTYNVAGIGELGKGIKDEDLQSYISEVLPSATKLSLKEAEYEGSDVFGIYEDEAGTGLAIHLETKGYGGAMTLLIGINSNGEIAGIKVLTTQETPNVGTKVENPEYIAQYIGKNETVALTKDGGDIDGITSATVSSRAMTNAVNRALEVYKEVA